MKSGEERGSRDEDEEWEKRKRRVDGRDFIYEFSVSQVDEEAHWPTVQRDRLLKL